MNSKEKELLQQTIDEIYDNKTELKIKDRMIEDYIRSYKDGKIIVPKIQREEQYTNAKKSGIIESIFRGIPIPPLCLIEKRDGTTELVDGLQRTTSIVGYIENKYPLTSLQYFIILEGMYFKDLPIELQKLILNYELQMQVVSEKKGTDKEFVRDVFVVTNQGSEKLSKQQLREARYYGIFVEGLRDFTKQHKTLFTKKLASAMNFSAKGGGNSELILNCIASSELYLKGEIIKIDKNVGGRVDEYLQNNKDNKEVKNILQDFLTIFNFINDVIGYEYLLTKKGREKYSENNTINIPKKLFICLYILLSTKTIKIDKISNNIILFRNCLGALTMTDDFEYKINGAKTKISEIIQDILDRVEKDFA